MGKKIIGASLAVICVGSVLLAARYIKNSGIFRDYPEAEYLTGDEEALRPVYCQLSDEEKTIYTALYRGISAEKEKIPLPMDADGDMYSRVYCMLEKQEGSFFYLDSVYYTADKVRDARMVYREKYDIVRKKAELKAAVNVAARGASGMLGDAEKARYINDYLVKRCRYVTGDDNDYASTSYGCLVLGEANCEGYAKAFGLLSERLGVESIVVTGTTDKGENHAWNQVKIDEDWFNIDVTWADTDVEGEVRQMYFLCTDDDFSKTHFADSRLFKPFKCTNDSKNYFTQSGLYATSYDEAVNIVRRELASGNGVIELKFSDIAIYNMFKNDFINEENIFAVIDETGYLYGETVTLSLKENEQECCLTLEFS